MSSAALTIERLRPDELTSTAYRTLVSARFGPDSWEAHLRYYRWLLQQNPAARADEPLSVYVCRAGDELIGHLGVIPTEVVFEGTSMRAAWNVDHFVLPAYQRKHIGLRLNQAALRDYPLSLSIGQTAAGYRWSVQHGYHVAGTLMRYKRLLRPFRGVSKRAMEKVGLATAARALFGMPTAVTTRAKDTIEGEAITSFADRIGEPHDLRGASQSRAGISRTPAFMQWRYVEHPFFRYEMRRFTLGTYGDAYAVWRLVDDALWQRGTLVDLVYPDGLPHPTLARIVAVVMECMHADGVELVQCQTTDAALIAAFGPTPFSVTEPGLHFVHKLSQGHTRLPASSEQWRLYPGDCDADTHPRFSQP